MRGRNGREESRKRERGEKEFFWGESKKKKERDCLGDVVQNRGQNSAAFLVLANIFLFSFLLNFLWSFSCLPTFSGHYHFLPSTLSGGVPPASIPGWQIHSYFSDLPVLQKVQAFFSWKIFLS